MRNIKKAKGFTLIEILVVIGIIAVLAAIVIIAINPARQFAQARNSQRLSNINTLLNAIGQNMADNKGVTTCPPVGTGTASSTIGSPTSGTSVVDLGPCLTNYVSAGVPMDPAGGTVADTKYQISRDTSSGRYLICAPNSDETGTLNLTSDLCVTR